MHADKPLTELAQFAAALGWPDLRIYQHRHLEGDVVTVTTWYESGVSEGLRSDFFLQINEAPAGQSLIYAGAVYAMRYRLCSGWRPFALHDSAEQQAVEVAQVGEWLHRRWYDTVEMRREFRRLHPECANYSWRRIRKQGPPYTQSGVATA
jgi:hypothetical protein